MTVDYETYRDEKAKFLEFLKDWRVSTSSMNEYGCYHKEYVGERGMLV